MTNHPDQITSSYLATLEPVELFELLLASRDDGRLDVAIECSQLFAYRMLDELDRWFAKRAATHQIEELVGETIERVVASTMRENSRFRGTTISELYKWIYTIARNTLVDHLRSPRQQADHVALHQPDPDSPDQTDRIFIAEEAGFAESELLMIRDEVLSGFSADHCEVIMMRVYEDRSSAEVAKETGKSVANVDQIKSRYGKAFRAALEAAGGVNESLRPDDERNIELATDGEVTGHN